jgi:hypothetical protein
MGTEKPKPDQRYVRRENQQLYSTLLPSCPVNLLETTARRRRSKPLLTGPWSS